jgi:aldose 1-epimerase
VDIFGKLPDGREVNIVTIEAGGLTANIMNWGAVVQDLQLTEHEYPLVLGFEEFSLYPEQSPYFGAIAGRFANRIANGRFTIDGKDYRVDTNFLSKHALHGGSAGIGRRLWTFSEVSADVVTLFYRAANGEMGFPGNLDITCSYSLKPEGRLVVELTAETDAPTLCNLAHHSYFNLEDGGRSDALDHMMQIDADAHLPVDAELIPTGEIRPVAGTDFDFRNPRPIRNDHGSGHKPYDNNFCLTRARGPLRRAAIVKAPTSGVEMQVWTTEPGVQLYDGVNVAREMPGLQGALYQAHAGFCLEAQAWPDAPNHPEFPSAVLRPGERYHQITEYRFRAAG